MKVLVEVWTEIDPTLSVRVDRASGEPQAENGDQLRRVSRQGRAALDLALSVPGAEVIAFALGEGHREALRHALAAGAKRSVEIIDEEAGRPSPGAVSEWLRSETPQITLVDRSLACLAAPLGWAHVAGTQSIEVEGEKLVVTRALGRGARERVEASFPVLLRTDPSMRPRYVSRDRQLAARAPGTVSVAKVATPPVVELGTLQMARTRARLGSAAPPPTTGRASDRLAALMGAGAAKKPVSVAAAPSSPQASAESSADRFVRYLAHHQLLEER